MRAHDSNLLILLGLLAMAGSPATALAAGTDAADADELETDDLPPWAEVDSGGEADPQAQVQMLRDYGTDIPDPEDVMAGRRPQAPIARDPQPVAEPPAKVELEDFRSELSSHGRWVDTPEYGSVFVPYTQTQVTGWRPYLYGQWAWTAYGWTWVSEEPFGWATYHYGRWAYRPALGWVWVPGYTWAPAWVVWRYGEGAVGWAPMYPGYVTWTASYPYYADHWIFVGNGFFYGHPVHRHWYRDRSAYWYGRSHWSRNWRGDRGHVYVGPSRRHVERSIHGRILESRVVAVGASRRGERFTGRGANAPGEVRVYRPTNRGAVRSRGAEGGRRTTPVGGVGSAGRVERPTTGNRFAPKGQPERRSAPSSKPAQRSDRPRQATPQSPGSQRSNMQRPSQVQPSQVQPAQRSPGPAFAPRPRSDLRPTGGPGGGLRPAPSMPTGVPRTESRSAAPRAESRFTAPRTESRSAAPRPSVARSTAGGGSRPSSFSGSRPAAPRPAAASHGGGGHHR